MPILAFEHITKEYSHWPKHKGTVRALDHFSLTVKRGEIFGFLGPNGAGKTTAIHLALGFMRPSAGRGTMLGHPFGDAGARRQVGFLAENVALYQRPALKSVRFYGSLNGMGGSELERRAREVLSAVGLWEERKRNIRQFSRGMLQRVGLAQALVNDPELLILDEPTSALDPASRVAVRELLLDMRRRGKTVFLSSHLLSEIELVCERVAMIRKGRVVRLGRTADLLESQEDKEVVARGMRADDFAGVRTAEGMVSWLVPSRALRETLETVWNKGGEVVSVNPVRRTLEEVFLEATTEDPATEGGAETRQASE